MNTLETNPKVVAIVGVLALRRDQDLTQLARATDTPAHQLAHVLREMQRAHLITCGRHQYARRIYYNLAGR